MQLLPKKSNLLTPDIHAFSITFVCILKLSIKKSAGCAELAKIPPTFAAANITTVGLYNDNNDLLATAKLSKPLLKDFTKEALVRIKLDY